MHNPGVLAPAFASGSICHHLQDTHGPQLSLPIVIFSRKVPVYELAGCYVRLPPLSFDVPNLDSESVTFRLEKSSG